MAAHHQLSTLEDLEEYIEEEDIKHIHISTNPERSFISVVFEPKYQLPADIKKPFLDVILHEIAKSGPKLKQFTIIGYQTFDLYITMVAFNLRKCVNLTHLTVKNCQHKHTDPISPLVLLLELLPNLRIVSFRDNASWLDEANINKIIEIIQTGKNKSIQEVDIMDSWYIEYSESKDDYTTTTELDEYRRERHDMLDEKIPKLTNAIEFNKKLHFKSSRRLYAQGRKQENDDEVEKALILYRSVQEVIKKGGKFKLVE